MEFLKTLGASLLAWIIGFGLLIFVIVGMIVGALSSLSTNSTTVSNNSVLYLDFNTPIVDAPATSLFSSIDSSMNFVEPITMLQLLATLERAAEDDRIEGYLHCSFG